MKHAILVNAVAAIAGASFIGMDTRTEVKLTGGRKNPHQGRVTKRMIGANVMVFSNQNINGYEAMVKRRLEQEGKQATDFVLGPRAWGTRVPGMPIVEHNDAYYLEVIFLRAGTVFYELDGVQVPDSAIQGIPVVKVDADSQGGVRTRSSSVPSQRTASPSSASTARCSIKC